MVIVAFAISIIAVVVSLFSVFYVKKQADAQASMARVDAARRREERQPTMVAEVEPVNDGQWHRLWLRLTSAEELSSLEVEIADGHGAQFTTGQRGVPLGVDRPVLHAFSADEETGAKTGLKPDHSAVWALELPEAPQDFRLRVTAAAGHDHWEWVVPVAVPAPDQADAVW